MKTDQEITPVEVFAGTMWEAGFIQSLLENEEIEAFLKDQYIGTLAPWYASPGGVNSISVLVSNLDYEQAKRVVDEFEKNRHSENNIT